MAPARSWGDVAAVKLGEQNAKTLELFDARR